MQRHRRFYEAAVFGGGTTAVFGGVFDGAISGGVFDGAISGGFVLLIYSMIFCSMSFF